MIQLIIGKTSSETEMLWAFPNQDDLFSTLYYFANDLDDFFIGIGLKQQFNLENSCFLSLVVGYCTYYFEQYYSLVCKMSISDTIRIPIVFEDAYLVVLVVSSADSERFLLKTQTYLSTAPSPFWTTLRHHDGESYVHESQDFFMDKTDFLSKFKIFIDAKNSNIKKAKEVCNSPLN